LEVGFAGLERRPAMKSCIAAKSYGFIQHNIHVPVPEKKKIYHPTFSTN
jgi:hypothetical protein